MLIFTLVFFFSKLFCTQKLKVIWETNFCLRKRKINDIDCNLRWPCPNKEAQFMNIFFLFMQHFRKLGKKHVALTLFFNLFLRYSKEHQAQVHVKSTKVFRRQYKSLGNNFEKETFLYSKSRENAAENNSNRSLAKARLPESSWLVQGYQQR